MLNEAEVPSDGLASTLERADPRRILDDSSMSSVQVKAVTITAVLSAIDGYDVLAMTFAAPAISRDWGIGKGVLGMALSSGLVGMALGSLLIAPLADRFGRKPLVLFNLILMTFGMLMAALSGSILELSLWRVVAGAGIGGMVPIIAPLAAEFANRKQRTLAIAVMAIGYPLGGTVGGSIAGLLLRRYDWPVVFLFGASMTFLCALATLRWLPESLDFLLARRGTDRLERLNALLKRCGHTALTGLPPADTTAKAPYRKIFAPTTRRATLKMTAVNLLFILTVYFVLSWMPQMVADFGYSPSFATFVSTAASFSGALTCIALGFWGAGLSVHKLAAFQMVGFCLATIVFGFAPPQPALLIGMAVVVGAFLYSGIVGLYGAIVATFEPDVRATGTGFVMGIGRASGAIAPALAGHLFAIGVGRETVSIILASGTLVAGLLILQRPKAAGS